MENTNFPIFQLHNIGKYSFSSPTESVLKTNVNFNLWQTRKFALKNLWKQKRAQINKKKRINSDLENLTFCQKKRSDKFPFKQILHSLHIVIEQCGAWVLMRFCCYGNYAPSSWNIWWNNCLQYVLLFFENNVAQLFIHSNIQHVYFSMGN